MKEPVCLLTDDVFTAWCLVIGAGCAVLGVVSLLSEVYERGYRAGESDALARLQRVGRDVVREMSERGVPLPDQSAAWRVVRRMFG
jgi:hypothetical protein